MKIFTKLYFLYFLLSTLIGVIGIACFQHNIAVQEPQIAQIESNLKQEYDLIPVLSGSKLIRLTTPNYSDHVMVGGSYSTNLGFEDIRKYYDNELTKNGWKFYKETKNQYKHNGNNYEGLELFYKKGDYFASIVYPGVYDEKGTFALYLSWNLLRP